MDVEIVKNIKYNIVQHTVLSLKYLHSTVLFKTILEKIMYNAK